MSRRYRGYYPVSVFSRRRWQKSFSTRRFLLAILLVVGAICLMTWFLYTAKGGT
jgi:hypothetical protein